MCEMNFALCCDSNYFRFAMTAATSIALAHPNDKIIIHILGNGLGGSKNLHKRFVSQFENVTLHFYDVSNFETLLCKSGYDVNREIGISAYIRLFLTEYLAPDIKTVLYLDCDILVLQNLKEIFQLNLQDKLIAAVKSTIDIEKDAPADKDHVNTG